MNKQNKPLLIVAGIGLFLVGSASLAQTDFFLPERAKLVQLRASQAFAPQVIPTVLFKDAPPPSRVVSPTLASTPNIFEMKKEYIATLSAYLSLVQDTVAEKDSNSLELAGALERGSTFLAVLQDATTVEQLQGVWGDITSAYACKAGPGVLEPVENHDNLCNFSWNDWSPDLSALPALK